MKKVFYFLTFVLIFTLPSCQKRYLCQCETINKLYNPNSGLQNVQNVYAKNKEKAKSNCDALSESWGDVTINCELR